MPAVRSRPAPRCQRASQGRAPIGRRSSACSSRRHRGTRRRAAALMEEGGPRAFSRRPAATVVYSARFFRSRPRPRRAELVAAHPCLPERPGGRPYPDARSPHGPGEPVADDREPARVLKTGNRFSCPRRPPATQLQNRADRPIRPARRPPNHPVSCVKRWRFSGGCFFVPTRNGRAQRLGRLCCIPQPLARPEHSMKAGLDAAKGGYGEGAVHLSGERE